jgi:hypothetical protein
MLGFSAAGQGYQDSSAAAARHTSTAMLASGIGMLGVGALLVVAGVRRRRR